MALLGPKGINKLVSLGLFAQAHEEQTGHLPFRFMIKDVMLVNVKLTIVRVLTSRKSANTIN